MHEQDRPWSGIVAAADEAACERAYEARGEHPMQQPALLLVDLTRQFLDPAYELGSAMGPVVTDAAAHLLARARESAIPVIHTRSYPAGYRPADHERGLWTTRGEYDPAGDEHLPDVAPAAGESVILKGSAPSAFFGTSLAAQLRVLGVDSLVVAGMTTSGCVRATVVDAFQHGFPVLVAEEAVGDRSTVSHAVSLFDIHVKYGTVASLDMALSSLQSSD